MACGLIAGWLFAQILSGRKPSLLKFLVAGSLAFRGYSGHCVSYKTLGVSTCRLK